MAELPLGTELETLERSAATDAWYHVKTDGGGDGWVLGRLTTPFDLAQRDETIESIVRTRLSRAIDSGESFPSRLQLFDLIERTAMRLNDRQMQARFALYRLRSMRIVLVRLPYSSRATFEPYRAWMTAHQGSVVYSPPSGEWMVAASYIAEVHEEYRETEAADDLAWFLVQTGLPGECEGDVPCYISWQNQLNGRYLRLHPKGRHAEQATVDLARILNSVLDNLQGFPSVLKEFDPSTRCEELHNSLDPLVTAVTESSSVHKADALAAIDRFAQLCR